MSDLAKRWGRRIYDFRKQNGLTQAALPERAKISNEFMSAVEEGREAAFTRRARTDRCWPTCASEGSYSISTELRIEKWIVLW
jgi:hypothetical protein